MKYCLFFIVYCLLLVYPAYADAESFFIDKKFDAEDRGVLTADALQAGSKSIFFAEREYYNSLPPETGRALRDAIEYLMKEFEERIYPQLREFFGEERNTERPAGEKIEIILHRMKKGVGGYVSEGRGEAIYININEATNRALAPAYLAHEFQHLITYNQKTIRRGLQEEQWLNEARSEYAPTLLGYNDVYEGSYLKKRVVEFLAHPSDALLDWRGLSVDHASAAMFVHYLVDRFGISVLTEMMKTNNVGIASIDEALRNLGHTESFPEVFSDWALAVHINSGTNENSERFKYRSSNLSFANLRVLPTTTFRVYDNNSSGINLILDNWSAQWHRFVPGAVGEETALHIRMSSVPEEGLYFPYIVSDFVGGTKVNSWNLSKGNIFSVDGFGKEVSSVTVVPIFASKKYPASLPKDVRLEGFISNSFVNRFAEGALVRAQGDAKVYVVKNSPKIGEVFMRWLQTPEVFSFYKHFTWNDVIEVKPEFIANFKESFLIRKAGDYKVYEVDKNGRKHWLNMPSADFEEQGYSWDAVYEVNEAEFAWHK